LAKIRYITPLTAIILYGGIYRLLWMVYCTPLRTMAGRPCPSKPNRRKEDKKKVQSSKLQSNWTSLFVSRLAVALLDWRPFFVNLVNQGYLYICPLTWQFNATAAEKCSFGKEQVCHKTICQRMLQLGKLASW
jgi:hypothetical protein